jgi:hypothetical protein
MGFGRMKYRVYSQKEWGFLFCLKRSDPQVKRSSSEVVLERSDPRRDCLKAEGRSSNLQARRAGPQARQRRSGHWAVER